MLGSLLLGVNLSGAEWGHPLPGVYNIDYTYPTHAEIDYYAAKGMNVIRLPFQWERLQHNQFGQFDAAELGRLDDVVNYATGKGLKIAIEPQNFGYWNYTDLIGTAQAPNTAFADLWGKLAAHYQANSGVIFDLMNEPHDQTPTAWLGSVNAAIAAIRGSGATQEILVPGTDWDGAWTWITSGNAAVIGTGVQDPGHNFAFEVHQYLDPDGGGEEPGAASTTIGVERLTAITQWAEATGSHLFLGEVGVSTDQTSLSALDNMLTYMQQHTGVWQAAVYWAGGPWWDDDYIFSIEPLNGVDRPQMGILTAHLSGVYNGTPNADIYDLTGDFLRAFGNDGSDQLYLIGNQNLLQGGNDNDTLRADGTGNDLYGDAGNDSLTVFGGSNQLYGGTGNDSYFVDNIGDVVTENAGEGSDTVYATIDFTLGTNVENLVMQGAAGLQGYGNSLANAIYGNSGNNTLDGKVGADLMAGGLGDDSYFVDNAGDVITENANGGADTVYATASLHLGANIENLVLQGSADLQGFGNSVANAIYGNTGSNILDGDVGADLMVGGGGNDAYYVDNAGDTITENANEGTDTVYSTAHLRLTANLENLLLQGTADLQGFGNALSNAIYGNSGNNLLDGDVSADSMYGGAGADTYYVDNIADVVVENANEGNDTVHTTANLVLAANCETLILDGSADLQGFGNSIANAIYGNSGNNQLDGGIGGDSMYGGAGNDVYYVDNIADVIVENANQGTDTVFSNANLVLGANVEQLVLQGSGDLQGYGNNLVNAIYGNSGNNVLDGGGGADALTGNAGNDTFVFHAGQGNGDTVIDFAGNGAAAGDALLFSGYGAGATLTNVDATHWQVNYNGGASHDVITFLNGASIHPTDFSFI